MTLFDQYLQRAPVENVSSTSGKLYRCIFEEDIADYIAIYWIYEWMKCCQIRNMIDEWFILLQNIISSKKSQLVTSYSLKLDVFKFLLYPIVNMYMENPEAMYINKHYFSL
jgi:hypothetical protein